VELRRPAVGGALEDGQGTRGCGGAAGAGRGRKRPSAPPLGPALSGRWRAGRSAVGGFSGANGGASARWRPGDLGADAGARAGRTGDGQGAVEGSDAVLQAGEPTARGRHRAAGAVVLDREYETVGRAARRYSGGRGFGVLGHVGQRLGGDEVGGRFHQGGGSAARGSRRARAAGRGRQAPRRRRPARDGSVARGGCRERARGSSRLSSSGAGPSRAAANAAVTGSSGGCERGEASELVIGGLLTRGWREPTLRCRAHRPIGRAPAGLWGSPQPASGSARVAR
jgi:hypothetical protein